MTENQRQDKARIGELLEAGYKPDSILLCEECGSPRISHRMWVDANTEEVIGTGEDDGYYCETCEEIERGVMSLSEWYIEEQHRSQEEMNQ